MLYATMRIGNNCEYFLFQSIPYIVASVIIGIGVDYFIQIIESRLLRIIICLGIFLISYLVALRLFDRDNLNFLLSLLPRRSLFPKLKK